MTNAKTNGLMEKNIFLQSSELLIIGFADLASRRLVDVLLREGVQQVQSLPSSAKDALRQHGVTRLPNIDQAAFKIITSHIDESYITLSYSWLETYLSLVEEALYLHDPRSLGDNIQIKLGKILEANSFAELVHDAVKRRLKEKSGWGLKGRLFELRDAYGICIHKDEEAIDNISRTRNELVHDKRVGDYTITKDRVKYQPRASREKQIDVNLYLDTVVNLVFDLFIEASKVLKIDGRSKKFRFLRGTCEKVRHAFKDDSIKRAPQHRKISNAKALGEA